MQFNQIMSSICPRDIYANNRTLAAGIRTALSLFAFGVIVIKMDLGIVIGYSFLSLGIIQIVYSEVYYILEVKKLKNKDHIFNANYFDMQLILSCCIGVALISLLFVIIIYS